MSGEKERFFDAILESRDTLLIGIDRDGRIVVFNPACEKTSGYSKDEILGKHFLGFPFSQHHERSLQGLFDDFLNGRLGGSFEFYMPSASGEERLISWTLNIVNGEDGEPEIALAVGRDITSLRRAREAIARSEEHFRQLIENALDLVVILRPDGIVSFASPSIRYLLGYDPEDMIGQSVYKFIHPMDIEASHAAIEMATLRAGVTKYFELRVRHRDGSWRIHEASSFNLLNSPTIGGLVINSRDITERRETELALEESRRALTTLLRNLPGMAYRCRNDPDWTAEFVSEGCLELTGYKPSDFIANATVVYGDLIHPEDRDRVWNEVQEALAKKEPFVLVYRIKTADGEEKWIGEKGRGIFSPRGELEALEGFNTDITDRMRSEMLLRIQRDLAVDLSGTSDLGVVLEASMKAILRATGMDSGGIYLVDEESGGLDLVYHEGLSPAFVTEVSHYETDSPGARLVMEGRPIFQAYTEVNHPETEAHLAEDLKAVAVIPILGEGRVIGCMNAASHTHHDIPRHLRDALETLAGQIGQAIVRTRLVSGLRDSEELYRLLYEHASLAIFSYDRNLNMISINQKASEQLGYSAEELLGRNVLELGILHPDDFGKAVKGIEALLGGAVTYTEELRLIKKDGEVMIAEITGAPLRDSTGEIVAVIDILLDITGKKRAEEALKASEERFRMLAENARDIIFRFRLKPVRGMEYMSPSVEAITGYTPEDFYTDPDLGRKMIHPDDYEIMEPFRQGVEPGGPFELRSLRKDGEVIWQEQNFTVVYNDEGEMVAVDGIVRDITDRKLAEEALRENEERYRATFESTGTAMGLVEPDGTINLVNRGFEEMFACSREDVEGKRKYTEFVFHEDLELVKALSLQLLSGEKESRQFECRLLNDEGNLLDVLVNVSLLPGREMSVISLIDITDSKKTENAVRSSEERYRTTFETTGTAMFLVDRDAVISDANREMEEVFGYSRDEVVGKMRYMELLMPEDVEKVKSFSRDLLSWEIEGPIRYEIAARHKTGRPIDALININFLPEIGKSVVSLIDITEKKAYERMLEERTEQLRDFLDIAAHELRHPATLLKGYAITLSKHGKEISDEAQGDSLRGIEVGSDRLVYVVDELLDVSRLQRGRFTVNIRPTSVRQFAERAVGEMSDRGTGREVLLNLADDVNAVLADPERLARLFIILLDNAVKYSPPGSVVELQGEKRDAEVIFSVLDRGSGIPEEERDMIFERFFQVKDVLHHAGPGLGLGLYIAKRIVEAHGGSIWYEPREGGGSIFRFSIPSGT